MERLIQLWSWCDGCCMFAGLVFVGAGIATAVRHHHRRKRRERKLAELKANREKGLTLICGACTHPNREAARFCRRCGGELPGRNEPPRERPALPKDQRAKRAGESAAAIWCPSCDRYGAVECGKGKAQCDCMHVFNLPVVEDRKPPECRCGAGAMSPQSVGWYCSRCGRIDKPEATRDVAAYNRAAAAHAAAMAAIAKRYTGRRRRVVCPRCDKPRMVKHPYSEYRQCVACGYAEDAPAQPIAGGGFVPCGCGNGYMIPHGEKIRRCVTCGKESLR